MSPLSELETVMMISGITEDQRQFYYKSNGHLSTIVAIILLLSLAWGSFMKVVIYSYFKSIRSKEKLINIFIMFDVIYHHIMYIIYIPTYAGILLTKNTPACMLKVMLNISVTSQSLCHFFTWIGWLKFNHSSASGFGMALFRVLCIRKTTWVKSKIGENKLILLIALATALISGLAIFLKIIV